MDNNAAQWIGYTVCRIEAWALMIQTRRMILSLTKRRKDKITRFGANIILITMPNG